MLCPLSKLSDHELVARFVIFKRWIRKDRSIKPDAFTPPHDGMLSVTRHKGISAKKLWKHGKTVVRMRSTTYERKAHLLGRADVRVSDVRKQNIEAVPHPIWRHNWNHAHLVGWPTDPAQRKMIRVELAASAQFVPFKG